jgi:hypothetical protein
MKWKMISHNHFEAIEGDYNIVINPVPQWYIVKGGELIDCFAYNPCGALYGSSPELAAKIQSEKALQKLLQPDTQFKQP